jgi:hypothetical protein
MLGIGDYSKVLLSTFAVKDVNNSFVMSLEPWEAPANCCLIWVATPRLKNLELPDNVLLLALAFTAARNKVGDQIPPM